MSNIIIKYPLDLTGRSPANLVAGEPHSLVTAGNRVIVPHHGPFFTRSLVVRRRDTGAELEQNVDYVAAQLLPYVTIQTGQEICAVVIIRGENLGMEFEIDYQVVGGDYSTSVYAIEQMIETLDIDERAVRWGDIIGKPTHFPPAPHLHDIGDTYGWEYIVAALEQLRQAILLGDEAARQELMDLIEQMRLTLLAQIDSVGDSLQNHLGDFNNPHNTTKAHVGLGSVLNYGVATQAEAEAGTSNVKYMTPLRVRQAIDSNVPPEVLNHLTDYANPHQTTKAHVGLGSVQNYPVSSQAQAQAGTHTESYMTPLRVAQAITTQTAGLGNDLTAHVSNTNNPHNTTKSHVGLASVENYPVATQAEAQAGTASNRYMTPLRTAQAVTSQTASLNTTVSNHIADTSNPHSVTKAQVGLGSVANYGVSSQAEAQAGTANNVYMTPLRVKQAIDANVPGGVMAHLTDFSNPHQVTKSQVGLGSVQNYDIATQAQAQAGTANNLYMTPLRVAQAIATLANTAAVNAHISNTSNPHNVTKAQVGLGSVENYGIATASEATAGTSNVKYMTPLHTKAAVDAHGNLTNNPHNTTKAHVGLGSVQNYGVASQTEAEAGTASNVYMTPQRTAQAISSLIPSDYIRSNTAASLTTLRLGGASGPGYLYTESGGFSVRVGTTSANYHYYRYNSNGNLTIGGRLVASGGFQPSDRNLKKDIRPGQARELWQLLDFVTYRMIADDTEGRGVIAQQVHEVAPDLVEYFEDRDAEDQPLERMSVNYTGAAFEMGMAAGRQIDELKARVARLEALLEKALQGGE